MLGMLMASNLSLTQAPSSWSMWVKYLVKEKSSVKHAAMVHTDGRIPAVSKGFSISTIDVLNLMKCFRETGCPDRVSLSGKTYMIKHHTQSLLVAFNGSKYCIVSKSKQMLIVTVCKIRSRKYQQISDWLSGLSDKLALKGY